MTELAERRAPAAEIEEALLAYVVEHQGATATSLIPDVSAQYRGTDVRGAYWKLLSESRILRAPNGTLSATTQ